MFRTLARITRCKFLQPLRYLCQSRYAQILTIDSAQQHPIEGSRGSERPTTEFNDTHRKENSDQPAFPCPSVCSVVNRL